MAISLTSGGLNGMSYAVTNGSSSTTTMSAPSVGAWCYGRTSLSSNSATLKAPSSGTYWVWVSPNSTYYSFPTYSYSGGATIMTKSSDSSVAIFGMLIRIS